MCNLQKQKLVRMYKMKFAKKITHIAFGCVTVARPKNVVVVLYRFVYNEPFSMFFAVTKLYNISVIHCRS